MRLAALLARLDQFGQAMQGLRAEHDVDVGCAFDDGHPLLAGNAATDADDQCGVLQLERTHPAKIVKHLFLRLLTHRAGVKEDDVRVFRGIGPDDTVDTAEQIDHLV